MPCPKCPCPDLCLARPEYCDWAAEDPPDRIKMRAIVDRSRIAAGLPPLPGDAVVLQPAHPTLAGQAASLGRALWDWAISGFSMASDEEVARRRSICAGCPRWEAGARRCTLCGCATDYKTRMRTEHCPEARW